MQFIYSDGGRAAAGYKGHTSDCVVRAIAIATELPYQTVYVAINEAAQGERRTRKKGRSSARLGVYKPLIRRYLAELGWTWHPTMQIGSGCKVHLVGPELPMGRLIVSVSKHLTAVIDRVVYDTADPQREIFEMGPFDPATGRNPILRVYQRCVYGYWTKEA